MKMKMKMKKLKYIFVEWTDYKNIFDLIRFFRKEKKRKEKKRKDGKEYCWRKERKDDGE